MKGASRDGEGGDAKILFIIVKITLPRSITP